MRYKKQSNFALARIIQFYPKLTFLCREYPCVHQVNKPRLGLPCEHVSPWNLQQWFCTFSHLGILLKCRLWFNMSGVRPRFCISNKLSGKCWCWSKDSTLRSKDLGKWDGTCIRSSFGMFSYWMFGPSEITINKLRLVCLNARENTITESKCPASNEQFLQNSDHIIFKVKREIKYKK